MQHWGSGKAGSAPIKGAVEPSLASSSALLLPGTSRLSEDIFEIFKFNNSIVPC